MFELKRLLFCLIVISAFFVFFGCINPPVCGNGVCEASENENNCSADCAAVSTHAECKELKCVQIEGLGTNDCNADADCLTGPVCGNGICETGEDNNNCPSDC